MLKQFRKGAVEGATEEQRRFEAGDLATQAKRRAAWAQPGQERADLWSNIKKTAGDVLQEDIPSATMRGADWLGNQLPSVASAVGSIGERLGASAGPPAPGLPAPPAPALPAGAGAGASGQVGGSAGISMKASVPGGGGGLSFPPMPDTSPEIKQAISDQIAAIEGSAEISAEQERSKAKIAEAQESEVIRQQVRAQEIREHANASIKKLFDGTAKAQEVLNSPSQTPDPERYWDSHSKILFAIGVGLLTHAKADVGAVLSGVEKAIDRDIEQQKQTFNAPREAARNQIAGNDRLYRMMREGDQDDYEALRTTKALSVDHFTTLINKLAANTNSQLWKENAAVEVAKLQQSAAKGLEEAAQHRRTLAIQEANAVTQRMGAQTQRGELTLKQSEQGAGMRKLSENEKKAIQFSREGLVTIAEIRKVLGPESSLTGAIKDELLLNVPLFMNDAKRRDIAVRALNVRLATAVAKSSLQAHEQGIWLGEDGKSGILGSVGLGNMTQNQLGALERDLRLSYQFTVEGALPSAAPRLPSEGPRR